MNNTERLLIWFLAGGLATAGIAWVAFQVQQEGVAPAVLFPLAVGAAVGGALVAIGRFTHGPGRRAAVVGAVCFGLAAAVGQDFVAHRYRVRSYENELAEQPLAAAVAEEGDLRPTFGKHLARTFRSHGAWWTADLLLTAAAAGIVCGLGTRDGRAMQLPRSAPSPPGKKGPVEGNLE